MVAVEVVGGLVGVKVEWAARDERASWSGGAAGQVGALEDVERLARNLLGRDVAHEVDLNSVGQNDGVKVVADNGLAHSNWRRASGVDQHCQL